VILATGFGLSGRYDVRTTTVAVRSVRTPHIQVFTSSSVGALANL
jgi:hypothetical protein